MSQKVAVLVGGPGTGKTTELLNVMESAKKALGGDPFALGFASFTRAARAEAVARASAAWSVPPESLSKDGWFRTVHSVAYRQLGVQRGQLIDDKPESQRWVANALKVDVRVIMDDDSGYAVYAGDKAAAMALNCWEISRARIEPLRETLRRVSRTSVEPPPPFAHCKQFIDRYEAAKRLEERVDYSDLLGRFAGLHFDVNGFYEVDPQGIVPPKVRAWIFDEAQDASALVDRVCRRLAGGDNVLWVYLAGDPFQCQPAGTPVLTKSGYKPIELLDPDADSLIAFNKKDGRFHGTGGGTRFQRAWRDVDSDDLVEVTFDDGTKSVCTANHKWVVRTVKRVACADRAKNGSKACRFLQAANLLPGIHAVPKLVDGFKEANWIGVTSVRRFSAGGTVRVYSLNVERHHTYVTTNGVVTGNSIFGFGGSDCKHFMGWQADKKRIMPKSWRCPQPIMDLGERCIRQMNDGYWDRGIAPADHPGEIVRGGGPTAIIPKLNPGDDTLIIARCNYTLDDWADLMRKRGLPFLKLKAKDNTIALRGYRALWDLEHGEAVTGEDFACAVSGLPARGSDGALMVRGAKAAWEKDFTRRKWDVLFASDLEQAGMTPALVERILAGRWAELVNGGERWRAAAVKWGPDLATRPHIRIGTIHAAKGMEADSVILSTTTSRRVHDSQAIDRDTFDEERRIEYVGVTRARRKLIVSVEPCDYRMNLKI